MTIKNAFDQIIFDNKVVMKEVTLEEAVYGRRSVRKFKAKSVSDEIIKNLIDAAIQAPSACNFQNWKYRPIEEIFTRLVE